jgi:hypothetical protein
MPVTMTHEGEDLYRLDVRGVLAKAEFERWQSVLASELAGGRHVRLLVVLDGFEGWAPGDNWSDLGFYMEHGDSIDRIAIVGDPRWRSEMMMFAVADLRKGPVEFFPTQDIADARKWVGQR